VKRPPPGCLPAAESLSVPFRPRRQLSRLAFLACPQSAWEDWRVGHGGPHRPHRPRRVQPPAAASAVPLPFLTYRHRPSAKTERESPRWMNRKRKVK